MYDDTRPPRLLDRVKTDDRGMAVRDIGWHLWIAGTPGQKYFVKTVALIAKEKGASEAFFDQITTAAWNALERIGLGRKRPMA